MKTNQINDADSAGAAEAGDAVDLNAENETGIGAVLPEPEDAAESVLESVANLWEGFLSHIPQLTAGLLVLVITALVGWGSNRISGKILSRFHWRQSFKELFSRLIYIAIWVVGILVASIIVFPGLTPGKALATLGLGSIAIGFAFKDIFENFFAGILLLWRFPFENGDFIECEGISGRVEDVTIRNTLIRKTTGELVVTPNATLFKNPVNVLTNQPHRRIGIICGVAYGEDVDESRQVIAEAVRGCKTVMKDQPIEVFACEFADSSINFDIAWWTDPEPKDARRSRDEVVAAVKRALDGAGIEIPFPYRTLTFQEPIRLNAAGRDRENNRENNVSEQIPSE